MSLLWTRRVPFDETILKASWVRRSGCESNVNKATLKASGEDNSHTYLMLVTSQSRATAALHILLPRKPLPPQTTIFLLTAPVDIVGAKGTIGRSTVSVHLSLVRFVRHWEQCTSYNYTVHVLNLVPDITTCTSG